MKPIINLQILALDKYFLRVSSITIKVIELFFCIWALPILLVIRLIKPFILVRIGILFSSRIGHFAGNTELYLCEKDFNINVPKKRHVDFFYLEKGPICNLQMLEMWKRILRVWPRWILCPVDRLNRVLPGGLDHRIGTNTQHDRDVHNLLDRSRPHLSFNDYEESKGQHFLALMGVPKNAKFVCLIVRDSAYLSDHLRDVDCTYHNYRDSDVQNYVMCAKSLVQRGYYVLRMGVKVHSAINIDDPKIIDYATNGMRSDFMDIYLGAKCTFCISVGTGFDAIPIIFRRPIVYVNMVPVGYFFSFSNKFLGIFKHHVSKVDNKKIPLSKIMHTGAGFFLTTVQYEDLGISLLENSPEEIRDVVIEMEEKLNGSWVVNDEYEVIQSKFWEVFKNNLNEQAGASLHGKICARVGSRFLAENQWCLM